MSKEKSIIDYDSLVIKTKKKYLDSKMKYNWNYKFTEEKHETFHYFMIANHHEATKILFDIENKSLIEKTMYTTDVTTMMELQGQLKEENK